jgi:epoxyqueuosine reductase QueG
MMDHTDACDKASYRFFPAAAKDTGDKAVLSAGPDRAAGRIIEKTLEFGADSAGICRVNPKWLLKDDGLQKYGALDNVIVIIVDMDPDFFRTSPSPAVQEETQRGYRRMKEVASKLARYISASGYNALSAGNGTAFSIPQAVEAGLGKLGRNGMLLNSHFGPCLRISKVFTDLPLKANDAPGSYLEESCLNCNICVHGCPGKAIEEGNKPAGEWWSIDRERCMEYWKASNRECGACISVCPMTWRRSSAG